MLKSFKYEIYLSNSQKENCERVFGIVRWVYNWGLEQKNISYIENKLSLTYFDLIKKIVILKKQKEFEWLNEAYSQSIQMSLKNLDIAFTSFFKKQNKFPKFKSKKFSKKSIQYTQGVKIDFKNQFILIPKLGKIKFSKNQIFNGKIKTCTLIKTSTNRYFVNIIVEDEKKIPKKLEIEEHKTIGIDLGLKHFLIDSNGNKIENPKFFKKSQKKLAIHQKRLSKKKKGSKNYEEQKLRIAKCHEKIRFQRKDFFQKLSTKIVNDNQITTFCMETLDIKNMIKNRNFAKTINDVSWGMFVEMMKYKSEWVGKNFIQIGQFEASSKTCSCGEKNNELKLNNRIWTCSVCKTTHDRDVLAANNIKIFGLETAKRLKVEGKVVSSTKNKVLSSDGLKIRAKKKEKDIQISI